MNNGTSGNGGGGERVAPPSKLWLLLEGRAAGELATTFLLRPLLRRLHPGDGHPVLLLPGFLATDFSTRPLRQFLRDLGYWAHRWNLGTNLGPRGDLEQRLDVRLEEIYRRHGRRVSLIGWSLGGVYARALANRFPHMVRSVITLGSPFAVDTKANNAWRLYEWITDERLDDIAAARLDEVRRTPPVPTTSIFSRTDGIAAWQSSLQHEEAQAESVEVPGSHLGLGFNPLVLYVIADRLSQPEGAWQPFFRPERSHPPGVHRPPEARAAAPSTVDTAVAAAVSTPRAAQAANGSRSRPTRTANATRATNRAPRSAPAAKQPRVEREAAAASEG